MARVSPRLPRRPWLAALLLAAPLACRPAVDEAPPAPPQPQPRAVAPARSAAVPELPVEPPKSAITSISGVAVVLLEPGDAAAESPRWGDFVELRYRVWDGEGRLVGASRADRSERLATSWLPPGWAEAMMGMHPGAHAHVWVPEAQAYGASTGGPRGALRIDVHLVAVETAERVAVEDVPLLTPPPNALYTASGIAFVVLRAGTGTRHATRDGRVTVHYEGWTTADGNRFDSSYQRGQPATFPLPAVIAGWQEAVPLMVEGEKTRFWIPGEMAYGDSAGRPSGMLVFDIELIRIED